MGYSREQHVWCWTCGEQRDGDRRYLHRGDNPVLAHYRCTGCNDLLHPYPLQGTDTGSE